MRILLEYMVGNGTAPVCPLLTKPTDEGDSPGCEYNDWAYALFAVVAFIIVAIPFVAFICYVQRRIQTKKRARGLTPSISHDSTSPFPYQPIHREGAGYANYGATADYSSVEGQAVRSPSHDSTASLGDRLSQHQDTTSVASSRASVIPTYDDVSLGQRNALIAGKTRHPSNSETQRGGNSQPAQKKKERRSSHLSSDSQEKGVDQSGQFYDSVDVVTNVPKLQKQTVPDSKDPNQPPPKPPRQLVNEVNTAVTEEPVYSVLEGPEPEGVFQPPSNGVMVPEASPPSEVLEGAKPSEGTDGSSGTGDEGSPEYAVVDRSPEVHDKDEDQTQDNEDEQRDRPPSEEKTCLLVDEKPADDSYFDEATASSPPGDKYLTILPPTPPVSEPMNEPSSEKKALLESGDSHKFDQCSVSPREEPSKSRTDFEEFLLDKVRVLPANERNGTFLIRNSISSTGSKVLTLFCWKSDSNKELYNFKINLTEEGQVFLHRSTKKFSDLNGLLEYLRKHKDMLPCVLTTQVFP